MTLFNRSARCFKFAVNANRPNRVLRSLPVMAGLGLLLLSGASYTARAAHAAGQTPATQAALLYIPGHLYLSAGSGPATDVTSDYVQTGSAYDSQKGRTVQVGYVTQSSGNIDVTVDIDGGEVEDWDHHRIGFVERGEDLPDDIN